MPLRRFRIATFAALVAHATLATVASVSLAAETARPVEASAPAPHSDRALENLAAFARAYGYIRFFHPTDQAFAVDWDRIAILGAEAVHAAPDDAALRTALRNFFAPLGDGLDVLLAGETSALPRADSFATSQATTYWHHLGVRLSDQSNLYRSVRTRDGRFTLFEAPAPKPDVVEKPLNPRLRLVLPLVVSVSQDEHKTPRRDPAAFAALEQRIAALDLKTLKPDDDWRLRVAGVVVAWNVFQHFHPYLDKTGVDWSATLRPALARALTDRTRDDYYATLSELVAKLDDGHGYVYGAGPAGGLPLRVAHIENQLVVTAVASGETAARKGDILLRVDDAPALDLLRGHERAISGSPHLRRHRALNQFGEGPVESLARLEVLRSGERVQLELKRTTRDRGFFFKPILEFDHPPLTELRPGIFYVNLSSCTVDQLTENLPRLATARGIIFDNRPSGKAVIDRAQYIQPTKHIIPHLIDASINASPMLVPQITRPDREGWTWRESTWPVAPKTPRLKARVVFLNVPSVVSYGETCMAMIAHHQLATLVGEPTAGCNGNVNFIPLPAGFRIMWTGMEVLKHDRSPFYGTGFVPDHPVTRTLAAVQENRDEFLEKALALLDGS